MTVSAGAVSGAIPPPRGAGVRIVPLEVELLLEEWMAEHGPMSILEAGCGSTSHFRLPPDAELVGVDISEGQLRRHTSLHRAILADIQSHDFSGESFDLVICWNVLEHVPDPGAALRNLASALAPGGLLVVGVPHLWSVKGVVTRLTPFSVHRLFYRLMGDRSVGREDFGQFPTVLARDVAPRRLREIGEEAGLDARLVLEYEGPVQHVLRSRARLVDWCFAAVGATGRLLSRGRYDPTMSEAAVILRRPSPPAARPAS